MNVPGEPIAEIEAGQLSKISFLLDKKPFLEGSQIARDPHLIQE
jgi:hypothetical protein